MASRSGEVTLGELAKHLGARLSEPGSAATPISGVRSDNRQVQPGDIFVAIPGASVHGARFAQAAVAAGAVAILTDPTGIELARSAGVPVLQVADPARAAGPAAAFVYGNPAEDLTTFAVTGTNGKTTTTYMIDHILRALGRKVGLIGTVEVRLGKTKVPAHLTTPMPADLQFMARQLVDAGGDSLVMEASSHALAQGRTVPMRFDVAGFTNLTQDHLDYHHTLEEYFKAKSLLFTEQSARRCVITVDDEWGRRLRENLSGRPGVVTLSLSGLEADWSVTAEGGRHYLRGKGQQMELVTQLPGDFNVANAALAVTMVAESGVPLDQIAAALGTAGVSPVVPGRMEVISREPLVVVDFAHNADALTKAMTALRGERRGELIVLTGSAGDRDRGKRPDMARAIANLADYLIVTDDDPHSEDPAQIRAEVLAGVPDGFPHEEIADRAQAIRTAIERAGVLDTVLIAGRGHETIQEVGGRSVHIDDAEVAREALQARGIL